MLNKISPAVSKPDEFALIARITSSVSADSSVVTGIGDDAAVTSLSPGMKLLTSTDMLLEDIHFRRIWHDPFLLGRKSLAVNISDIAAMGGVPRWVLLSIAVPADISLDFIDCFSSGFLEMAAEHGVTLIGGDTCSSRSALIISVTIMGEQYPEKILRRSGAMPDDDIWVTGTLGDAALGLKLLEEGLSCVRSLSRLLNPAPRLSAASALAEAGAVNSMIDISDGLLADFGHIAKQSNVGGCINIEKIPLSTDFLARFSELGTIPYHLPLSGGEDYELCFTAMPSEREKIIDCMKKSGVAATRIGIVTSCPDLKVLNPDGSLYCSRHEGFNHFK
ncbi:MAG: thiamine-phosphate kinase [Desulfuromonadaceae bacterium]|nr:thiamine-phosphate kinase [Desulfuromonadaceae bacterium]MDD2855298.1 thiamine-phosphate kinase [Desulfuromonadaceae bacterium]